VRGRVRILPDPARLAEAAAEEFVSACRESVKARGRFTVALAGGSTPRALYALLARGGGVVGEPLEWESAHFFWGDERHVPPDHPESNYRMVRETLLTRVPVPPANVHRVRGEEPDAGRAAEIYDQEIRAFFAPPPGEPPRFDLILLGMGTDGHTASLFPGTPALHETARWVAAPWVQKLGARRVTLTPPVLNRAARVVFLVSGGDKAETLRAVLEGPEQPERLPAQIVKPEDGPPLWIVDADAARLLPGAFRGDP
jgi:6-phosphogluconolactonase